MEYLALITVTDQKPEEVLVDVIDRNHANIYTTAATFEKGFQLIRDNIGFAKETAEEMEEYPETEKAETVEPVIEVTVEEGPMGISLSEEEAARYWKKIKLAVEFAENHQAGKKLKYSDLANLGGLPGFEAVYNAYCLGFKKGFMRAQKGTKAKEKATMTKGTKKAL